MFCDLIKIAGYVWNLLEICKKWCKQYFFGKKRQIPPLSSHWMQFIFSFNLKLYFSAPCLESKSAYVKLFISKTQLIPFFVHFRALADFPECFFAGFMHFYHTHLSSARKKCQTKIANKRIYKGHSQPCHFVWHECVFYVKYMYIYIYVCIHIHTHVFVSLVSVSMPLDRRNHKH